MLFVLKLVGVASAAVLLVVSAALNYTGTFRQFSGAEWGADALAGYDIATLISFGSLAFDGLAVVCGFLLYRLVAFRDMPAPHRMAFGVLVLVAATVCLAYSSWASIGFFSGQRGDTMAAREKVSVQRDNLEAKVAEDRQRRAWLAQQMPLDAEAGELKPLRPSSAIQAQIDRMLRDPATEGCPQGMPANGPVTRKICPQVDDLRAEKEIALRAEALDQRVTENIAALGQLKAVSTADPQSSTLQQLFGSDLDSVLLGQNLLFVSAFEINKLIIGVLLGLLFAPPAREPAQTYRAEQPDEDDEDSDEEPPDDRVIQLRPAESKPRRHVHRVVSSILRARDYPRLLVGTDLRREVEKVYGPFANQAFGNAMSSLGYERRRRRVGGSRVYVYERGVQACAA